MVRVLRKLALVATAGVLVAGALVVVAPSGPAFAHGAAMKPGSRTYNCWRDGLSSTGEIKPNNPACAAAVAAGGANPLYNWFGVLRSDAGGRTTGFIPDGQLCSGGNPVYAAYDAARTDWPLTHITAGANFEFWYSNWAHHPGTFYFYVTNANWSPTRPLAWSDLETPFLTVTNPPQQGAVGTNDGHYYFSGRFPTGKSGRQIIFSRWVRSDSQENFFGCSDVTFDGGNGEVTGIGPGGGGPTTGPTSGPTTGPTTGPTQNPGPGACAATYQVTSSWSGGFQGEVTVRNTGTSAINGWTASWANPAGQTISQVWNATATMSGSSVSVRNATYNGVLNANGSTTFGFLGSGTNNSSPTVSCSTP